MNFKKVRSILVAVVLVVGCAFALSSCDFLLREEMGTWTVYNYSDYTVRITGIEPVDSDVWADPEQVTLAPNTNVRITFYYNVLNGSPNSTSFTYSYSPASSLRKVESTGTTHFYNSTGREAASAEETVSSATAESSFVVEE